MKRIAEILFLFASAILIAIEHAFGEKALRKTFFVIYGAAIITALLPLGSLADFWVKGRIPPFSLLACMIIPALIALVLEYFRREIFMKGR